MSRTVTSHAKGFPLAQGRSVVPSGHLLSPSIKLTGSFILLCQLHHPTAETGCTHFHCPAAACDSTTAPSASLLDFDCMGANICEPHQCPCGAPVDASGLHCLSCRGGNGRSARHHSLNDLVWRAMAKADIPALKEPSGRLRTDEKRPDGVTLLPWKQVKCATWDVTVSDTLAQSYVCLLYTSPSPRDRQKSRMPSSA